MTVYFDHNVQFPGSAATLSGITHDLMCWHKSFPILAVSSKNEKNNTDGSVHFFLDEGELVEEASIFRSTTAECLEWHPENKTIAIGWRSGEITTYNHVEDRIHEQSSIHRAPLTVIRWNRNGTRIVSGDKSGLIIVWKVDSTGKLHPSPLHQHRLHASISHCVMLDLRALRELSDSAKKRGGSVLDAFSWQNKSSTLLMTQNVADPISCFMTTGEGALYYMDNSGDCVERYRMEGSALALLLNHTSQVLFVVTNEMMVSQFSVSQDGQTTTIIGNAKLSGRNKVESAICVADKILATCSSENLIRFWDFEGGDHFVLDIQNRSQVEEAVICIAYNPQNQMLAGGTNAGNLLLWKWREGAGAGSRQQSASTMVKGSGSLEGEKGAVGYSPESWEFVSWSNLSVPLLSLAWGSKRNLLSVNSGQGVQILSEHVMNSHFNQQVSVVQISPSELLVQCHSTNQHFKIKSELHIDGIYASKEHVALWGGRHIEVYALSRDKGVVRQAGSFSAKASYVALYDTSLYIIERKELKIRTFQGTVKQVLPYSMDKDGHPSMLSVDGHYLVTGSDTGRIKLWDISRREAKLQASIGLKAKFVPDLLAMSSVHCSNTGTRVSAIVEQEEQKHPLLLLWFVDSDAVKTFTPKLLTKSRSKDQPSPSATSSPLTFPPDLPTNSLQQQQQLAAELVGREPLSQHWDAKEHKMLVVEWSGLSTSSSPEKAAPLVSVLFVTPEKNVVISEIVPHNSSVNKFIGIKAPFLYYSKKGTVAPLFSTENLRNIEGSHSDVNPPGSIGQVTLRDFVGLEESNTDIINAMMDFSYYVAIGNMDEAFKAIRLVKSRAVWESMARVCVKTERLDVALICLGYMGNARAARAVRESKKVPEPEVRLAVLAVELGMLDEAEKLYRKSKRYDLLNQFYQYSGQWKKAIEVAETRDRMHLKTTYYNYARHAEELGELNAAINSYEKSNTHRFEVPRMLLDDPAALEGYVMKSKDKEVRKWWAEYLESCGEWEQAMQFYETAKDYYSLVRILCFNGQLARAAEVTEESGSKAAAYHLARRLAVENADPKRAIYFFTKAQCYSPAIQLAKENGLDHELMNLALLSKQEDMLDAAKYYEENSETIDKAILLFHKAGEVSHALDLCFQHHHYDVLDVISEDLHEGSSQETTQRVADYYMEKGLFDKAMEILVRTRRTEEAMKLCVQHSVPLTEELVERISIQKGDSETAEEAKHRVEVLEQLADCCLTMGSYHLAAKKYTQAGNRTKAMKALLKSGDTEKIVFFAGVSRQKDIYVMAANYLQTLDWRNDHSIMKNIISFYTKGKALDSLAGFYDACAQVEIDEFQNYSKAAGALDEAIKVLGKVKAKNPVALAAKIDFFKERVELVKKFAEAKSLYQDNPAQCVEMCQGLLDEPRLDAAVRAGDVYGLMIEHYASAGNFEQAYALMKEMRQRIPNVNLSYYIDIRVIENIHTAMGIPLGRGMGPEGREGEKVGVQRGGEEELEEEEVESDMDD